MPLYCGGAWPDGSTHVVLEPLEFLGRLAALVPPSRAHLVRYHGILAPSAERRGRVVPRGGACPRPEKPASTPPVAPSLAKNGTNKARPSPEKPIPTVEELLAAAATEAAAERSRSTVPTASSCGRGLQTPTGSAATGDPSTRAPQGARLGQAGDPEKKRRWRERMRRADLLKRRFGFDVMACPRCRTPMQWVSDVTQPGVIGKVLRAMGLPDVAPRAAPARPPPQAEFEFAQ